jgi:hypothetical protein
MAHGLPGMAGISLGLAALILAMPLGVAPALALALAVPMTWNLSIWLTSAADLKFLHHLPRSRSGTSNRKRH